MPRAEFLVKQRPQPFVVHSRPIGPKEWLRRSELVELDGENYVVVHPGRGGCVIQSVKTGITAIVGPVILQRMTRKTLTPRNTTRTKSHDARRIDRSPSPDLQLEFGL